jgi:uncharacterized membrane protein YkvA (DUF1232 family)
VKKTRQIKKQSLRSDSIGTEKLSTTPTSWPRYAPHPENLGAQADTRRSLAARDPGVPWYARILAIAVAGYALSPIDLIPDFIPVIGYLDDLIIVPLGIWLVVSLIPKEVMAEYRAKAIEVGQRPRSKIAAIVIIAIWIFAAAVLGWIGFAHWGK